MGPKPGQRTLLQAYREGYIPKKGAQPHAVWRGKGHHFYYNSEDQMKHPRAAASRLKKYMSKQRADRKATKEAEEKKRLEREAIEAARRELRENTKTRYQWARMGYIANDNAPWEWGISLGRSYGDWYKYTHINNVHIGSPKELEPWWKYFLTEINLKDTEEDFIKLRTELIKLSPEYPPQVLAKWIESRRKYFCL